MDTITKSGVIELQNVEIHSILGLSYAFDKSVMDTLVIDNFNPIEALEYSALLVNAFTQQQSHVEEMLQKKLSLPSIEECPLELEFE